MPHILYTLQLEMHIHGKLGYQSHLEQFRRVEAVTKLVPQAILQFYIILYTVDNSHRDLMSEVHCMTKTWILVGISVLKFSLDSAQNVKQYSLDEMKFFDRTVCNNILNFRD